MVAKSRTTIRRITPSITNDIEAPIDISTGLVENGPDVLACGTGSPRVGSGGSVVVTAVRKRKIHHISDRNIKC